MRFEATVRTIAIYSAVFILLLAILFLGQALSAQSGGQYDLSWSSMNSGGETFSIGGQYVLGATIGQPGAGGMTGGDYLLEGGFWHCFPLAFQDCQADGEKFLYLPIVMK